MALIYPIILIFMFVASVLVTVTSSAAEYETSPVLSLYLKPSTVDQWEQIDQNAIVSEADFFSMAEVMARQAQATGRQLVFRKSPNALLPGGRDHTQFDLGHIFIDKKGKEPKTFEFVFHPGKDFKLSDLSGLLDIDLKDVFDLGSLFSGSQEGPLDPTLMRNPDDLTRVELVYTVRFR